MRQKKPKNLIKQGTTHNDPNVEDYFLANVEVTPWTQGVSWTSERLMYVQFTSCVYGVVNCSLTFIRKKGIISVYRSTFCVITLKKAWKHTLTVLALDLYIFGSSKPRRSEAVVQRCSVNKVFLKISQNQQENTCARDSFLIKL